MSNVLQELATNNKQQMSYEVGGQQITLSPTIIRQFVTKGNDNITDQEAINFMMLCKYAELNPFMNDAYLIKYGNSPAQMVTSKEALLKRANRQADFKGITSGIVVVTKDGNVVHKKGQLVYPGEQLIGAWAEVKRSDFESPIYTEVGFTEYNTGKSMWAKMPAIMINKVAEATALRKAYPEQLGAMYVEEESEATITDVTPKDNLGDELTFEHNQPMEKEAPSVTERIKELRKQIKDENKDFKTLKAIDEFVAQKHGVESIEVLNEFAIFGTLKEMVANLPIQKPQENTVQQQNVGKLIEEAKQIKQAIISVKNVSNDEVDSWLTKYMKVAEIGQIQDWNKAVTYLTAIHDKAIQETNDAS